MAFRAPVLGYNTNVRHKGKLYHIQTEDSGIDHPHVITHLFADGGRIVASKKTSYAERVGSEGLADQVKKLMQAQHKAMFIALRDGVYDEDGADHPAGVDKLDGAQVADAVSAREPAATDSIDEKLAESQRNAIANASLSVQAGSKPEPPARPARVARSLFGGELLGDKNLDEVILNYLAANEPNEPGR
jgi:hypothetical protein